MLERRSISFPTGPKPGSPLSPGILVDGWLFVSGQVPVDSATGAIIGGTIEAQTERTLENLASVVEAAGGSLSDVVSITVHLGDISLFSRFNTVYERFFGDPKPTRTTVGSTLVRGMLVEMAAIARIGA